MDKLVDTGMACSHPNSGLFPVAAMVAAQWENFIGTCDKNKTQVKDRTNDRKSAGHLWREH